MANIPALGEDTASSRRCPVCGGPGRLVMQRSFDPSRVDANTFASRKRPELMHWSMALCVPCDLLFAIDPPGFDQLRAAYEVADFDAGRESIAAARTYEGIVRRMLLRPTGWPPDRLRILDVGCGDGAFLAAMSDSGASRVVGIEISEEPVRRARPDMQAIIEKCMIEDYGGTGFTLATTFQVLEHFSEPLDVLKRLHTALDPGGFVMGVVHDRRAITNRLLGRRSPIWDVEHLQLFSKRSMRALLAAAGFRSIALRHITNTYPAAYWLRLAPAPRRMRPAMERLAQPGGRELTIPLRVGNLAFVAQRD